MLKVTGAVTNEFVQFSQPKASLTALLTDQIDLLDFTGDDEWDEIRGDRIVLEGAFLQVNPPMLCSHSMLPVRVLLCSGIHEFSNGSATGKTIQ